MKVKRERSGMGTTPKMKELAEKLLDLQRVLELVDEEVQGPGDGELRPRTVIGAAELLVLLNKKRDSEGPYPKRRFYSLLSELERQRIAFVFEDHERTGHWKEGQPRERPGLKVLFRSDARERLGELSVRGYSDLERDGEIERQDRIRSAPTPDEWNKRVWEDIGRVLEELAILHGLECIEGIPLSDFETKEELKKRKETYDR